MPHQHHAKHHIHERAAMLEARNPDATVVQVVYETASKTFDGPVGGYSTFDAPPAAPTTHSNKRVQPAPSTQDSPSPTPVQPSTSAQPQPSTSAQPQPSTSAQPQPSTSAQPQPSTSVESTPTPIAQTTPTQPTPSQQPTIQSSSPSTRAQPVSSSTPNPSTPSPSMQSKSSSSSQSLSESIVPTQPSSSVLPVSNTPTSTSSFIAQSATSSPSSTPTAAAKTQSNGMSGGAKAGLAIGILLGIGALLALVFFCYRRKKQKVNESYEKHDDEKAQTSFANEGGVVGVNRTPSARSARGTSTAPQLSLRPVTEFTPDLAAQKARIDALAAAGGPARNQVNDSANPFGNHAEMSEKSAPMTQPTSPTNPFGNHAVTEATAADGSMTPPAQVPAPLRVRTPTPESAAVALGGAAAGAGLAAAGAGTGRPNAPKPLNLSPNRPKTNGSERPIPSPTGTEFSMTSVTPSAIANGPPPSNVHRIQLDFKPSMEDELGLRAGSLVRLLHEYDDGWALCIRLDRSQQGVAPRTCLSARPVKPRPPPGTRGPAQGPRGPPPGMMGLGQQRPSSPAGGRSPPSPYNRAPRSASPGPAQQPRSMSPGPYGGGPQRPAIPVPGQKRRSNSASDVRERRNSPPGPSPMNPNANAIPQTSQKVSMQLQAVTPSESLRTATLPQRKPVPGQAM